MVTVPRDARFLRGFVKGGTESVRLLRGEEVLRATRGPRTNDREVELRWLQPTTLGGVAPAPR